MIVDYINRYLESEGKELNEAVLAAAGERFTKRLYKQFMTDYVVKVGGYGAGRATKCARANGYYHAGVEGEPIDAATKFKFWLGDLAEVGALSLAELAFEGTPHSIGLNNEYVDVPIGPGASDGDGKKEPSTVKGFIDGMLNFNHAYHEEHFGPWVPPNWVKNGDEDLLLEVKSMGSYPFDLFCKEGPDDTWGYLGQISVYQRALRIRRFVYVAIDREKGRLAEFVGTYQKAFAAKADAVYASVMAAKERGTVPSIPPECAPVMGRSGAELGVVCSYCSYKQKCWEEAGYRLNVNYVRGRTGPKPIWTVSKTT